MHIVLSSLKIKNFRSISELELTFPEKSLVLIRGRNGSGKSSIFNAIYSCLYNRQLNGRPLNKAIKYGEDFCELTLIFQIDGITYELQRRIGKGQNVVLYKDGEKYVSGAKVKNVIEDLIPPDVVKLFMIQNINIRDLISNLVDVSDFITNISTKIKELQKQESELNTEIDKFSRQIENIDYSLKQLQEQENNILLSMQQKEQQLSNFTQDIDIKSVTEKQQKIAIFNEEFKTKSLEIKNRLNQKVSEEVDKPKQQYTLVVKDLQHQLSQKLLELDSELQKQLSQIDIQINSIKTNIQNLEHEKTKYQNLLKNKICFTCDREIDPSTEEKYINKINEIEQEIERLNNEISNLTNKKLEIQKTIESQKQNLTSETQTKITEINDYLQKLENYRQSLLTYDDSNEIQQLYQQLLYQYNLTEEDLNTDFSQLIQYVNKKSELQSEIEILKQNLDNINKQRQKLVLEKQNIEKSLKDQKLEEQLQDIKKQILILETWNNTRLLKKLLTKSVASVINSLIQTKYGRIINVNININEKDDIEVFVTNMNDVVVPIDDISTGESVIAKLTLYMALKELLSSNCSLNCLFLDEFLDSLDDVNTERAITFLRSLCEKENLTMFLITHRESLQSELYDDVISMDEN